MESHQGSCVMEGQAIAGQACHIRGLSSAFSHVAWAWRLYPKAEDKGLYLSDYSLCTENKSGHSLPPLQILIIPSGVLPAAKALWKEGETGCQPPALDRYYTF